MSVLSFNASITPDSISDMEPPKQTVVLGAVSDIAVVTASCLVGQ